MQDLTHTRLISNSKYLNTVRFTYWQSTTGSATILFIFSVLINIGRKLRSD